MEFSGRCEAMRAPTTENDTVRMAKVPIPGPIKISRRGCPLRRARIRLATASATHSAHSDQASHEAARWLILPAPRPCPLAPSVTTPTLQHYRLPSVTTTVLWPRGGNELLTTPLPGASANMAFSYVHLPTFRFA